MLPTSFILLAGLALVGGQYSEYESPLPPRPVIPGAGPAGGVGGGRRPAFRSQARRPEGGVSRGGGRRIAPPQEGLAPRRLPTPPPLPPLEPLPAAVRRLPPPLPPRPVVEEEEDEEPPVESTTLLPSLPPFRPAVFRPEEDFPPPSRPTIVGTAGGLLRTPFARYGGQSSFPEEDVGVGSGPIRQSGVRQPVEQLPSPVQQGQIARLRPSALPSKPVEQSQRIARPELSQPAQRIRPDPPARIRPQPQPQPQEQPQRSRPLPLPQEPQQTRPAVQRQQQQQQYNRQQQVVQRPEKELTKSTEPRLRKPTSQVLRKYREDNPDGSITWGFENDDGTFKEETIGVDCVTRGKYGYIDPDGVRREFSYSSGLPCDKDRDSVQGASNQGYIDYTNNRYVLPNGDYVELNNMVKNRARKPVYRN